jgi:hypothetical protein
MRTSSIRTIAFAVFCGACSVATSAPDPVGSSIVSTDNLTGCKGKASSSIPSDGVYVMTTFGGSTESQQMSCGSHTQNGSWYYAASRQRYGCGSKIRIEGNGKCVIAQTDDYGPDVCVENAAGRPIIDVSPLVAQEIFGVSGMGWSDNRTVTVSTADGSEALGPCSGTGTPTDPVGGDAGSGSGGDTGEGVGGSSSGGSSGSGSQCYCDDVCSQYGDCCSNCNTGSGGSSGSGAGGAGGSGGGGGASGCYCDDVCAQYGDCCSNCNTGSGGSSGSGGESGSGGASGSGGSGNCYCDASCAEYGDCCPDCV